MTAASNEGVRVLGDLSAKECAMELGCHRNKVYEEIMAGNLPAYRLGGMGPWRVRRKDLDAYRERYAYRPASGPTGPTGDGG